MCCLPICKVNGPNSTVVKGLFSTMSADIVCGPDKLRASQKPPVAGKLSRHRPNLLLKSPEPDADT